MCWTCNYHLWSWRHIQKFLTVDMANAIASSVVVSRLDYCNSKLYKTMNYNIIKLQRIQNKNQDAHIPTICLSNNTGCQSATVWVQDCSHHIQSIKIWSTSLSSWHVHSPTTSSCYEIWRSILFIPAGATFKPHLGVFLCSSINLELITTWWINETIIGEYTPALDSQVSWSEYKLYNSFINPHIHLTAHPPTH